jgi:lysophospholipase L1-like esterase
MKHTIRWIALLIAIVMILTAGITALAEEVTGQTAEAVGETSAKAYEIKGATVEKADEGPYYSNYVSIGDSCGSGLGLPQYVALSKEKKVRWLPCEKIEGSYPTLVAKAVGATEFGQYHFPGARTADIRYLLDEHYYADWVLLGQAMYLSNGVVSKANLDSYREEVTAAIRNADLISIDVGINDVWLPVIAAIYDIAEKGRVLERQLTIPELVAEYGSIATVVDNAASFVRAWTNPLTWPGNILKLSSALIKWVIDYQVNTTAIMNRIRQLNPNATVVVCGLYNPVYHWDLIPFSGDHFIEHVLQPYYSALNLKKRVDALFYWGDARYVPMDDIELFSDGFAIPLFEFTIEDGGTIGYNPHPTLEGAKQQAKNILNALGVPLG